MYWRGKDVEGQAFFYLTELGRNGLPLEQARRVGVPEVPGLELSPAEMFEVGLAKTGGLLLASRPELAPVSPQVDDVLAGPPGALGWCIALLALTTRSWEMSSPCPAWPMPTLAVIFKMAPSTANGVREATSIRSAWASHVIATGLIVYPARV